MNEERGYPVAEKLHAKYDDITGRTEAVCRQQMGDDFAALCRKATAALCRNRPTALARGHASSWAAGIAYALAQVNFLFDKTQPLHVSASELCGFFGVSRSTASSKAREVFEILDLVPLHPGWCLSSLLEKNPLAWMIQVNGLLGDARTMPEEVQREAYRLGLIPHLP